jgi:hypothetical protein
MLISAARRVRRSVYGSLAHCAVGSQASVRETTRRLPTGLFDHFFGAAMLGAVLHVAVGIVLEIPHD